MLTRANLKSQSSLLQAVLPFTLLPSLHSLLWYRCAALYTGVHNESQPSSGIRRYWQRSNSNHNKTLVNTFLQQFYACQKSTIFQRSPLNKLQHRQELPSFPDRLCSNLQGKPRHFLHGIARHPLSAIIHPHYVLAANH